MDVVTPAVRSRMMAGIKGKDTRPEMLVRRCLSTAGIRYRLHRRDLPGAPDIALPASKVAIFVHGCFWHVHQGCRFAKWPSTRPEFWRDKLGRNVERDQDSTAKLNMLGWRVLVVWECATRRAAGTPALAQAVLTWIAGSEPYGELGAEDLLTWTDPVL
jgi:DNA mismatch endonuclease, patch repair protein